MELSKHQNKAGQFISMLTDLRNRAEEIAKFAAEAYKEDVGFIDNVCMIDPSIPPQLIHNLIAAGQRRLVASLVWEMDRPGVKKLIRMPFEIQSKYSKEPLPLVLSNGEILQVDVRNLTPNQANQIFDRDHIRTEAEQRAHLEDIRLKQEAPMATRQSEYFIKRGNLVVTKPCTISPRQLAELLVKLQE